MIKVRTRICDDYCRTIARRAGAARHRPADAGRPGRGVAADDSKDGSQSRNVRGVVDTLTKVVEALSAAGIELLGDNAKSDGGGRGVRFKEPAILAQQRPAASLARGKKGRTIVRVK
jgi:hypothetical protein